MFAYLFYSKVLFTMFRFSSFNFIEFYSIFWKFITICKHLPFLIKRWSAAKHIYKHFEYRTQRAKIQDLSDLIFSSLLYWSVCLDEWKCKGFFFVNYIVSFCDISNKKKTHQIISQQKSIGYLVHKSKYICNLYRNFECQKINQIREKD